MQQPFQYFIKTKNKKEFEARVRAAEARGDRVKHTYSYEGVEPTGSPSRIVRRRDGIHSYENRVDNVNLYLAVMVKGGSL